MAADPGQGRPAFEQLVERAIAGGDRDLRWIARENLRNRRMQSAGPAWVHALVARLSM